MLKLARLVIAALLLALPAQAQQDAIIRMTSAGSSLPDVTDSNGVVTLATACVFKSTAAADGSSRFQTCTGTLATPSTTIKGVFFDITPAGSNGNAQFALQTNLESGATGNAMYAAAWFRNLTAGAGTADFVGAGGFSGSAGIVGEANANFPANGRAAGVSGYGTNGGNTSASIVGVAGNANNGAGTGYSAGGIFAANNAGTGKVFGIIVELKTAFSQVLATSTSTTSAVIVADNGAVAAPIFLGRDNGTQVFAVNDGGSLSGAANSPPNVTTGSGTGTASLGGVICKGAPNQATTGTTEQALATCTIPANTLTASGSTVRVTFVGHGATNANSKVWTVRVGGVSGTIFFTHTADTGSNKDYSTAPPISITRTGATTAASTGILYLTTDATAGGTFMAAYTQRAGAVTWANSNDLVIDATTATASGDLTLDSYVVEILQ